jgi:hypothetical protein
VKTYLNLQCLHAVSAPLSACLPPH